MAGGSGHPCLAKTQCCGQSFMAEFQPCTAFAPHLPDHSSLHTAPAPVHPTPLSFSPWLLLALPTPSFTPSTHSAACSLPLLLLLNSPASTAVPHSARLSTLPLHVFYPWAFSQALSFMTSAGEAPKKQTASGFSLHSQTPRQCHAGGHPQGSLGSAPTVQEGKKCVLPEEFFR